MSDEQKPPTPNAPPPPQPLSPELLQALHENLSVQFGVLVALFAPQYAEDIPLLEKIVQVLVQEEQVIHSQLLPSLRAAGTLIIRVRDTEGRVGDFTAQKRFRDTKNDCGIAVSTALVYAFVFCPVVRGLFRLYGFDYRFIDQKPKSSLILPGRA